MLQQTYKGNVAHFALVGKGQRVVQEIGSIAGRPGAGFTYNVVTDDYVAFVYVLTNVGAAQNLWRVYLFDRHRNKLTVVATNPVDRQGQPLSGGWVEPVLSKRYLYWLQAADTGSAAGSNELQQYNLATGKIRTLYRGLSEAIVLVGDQVWFSAVDPHAKPTDQDPPMQMAGVDEETGRPVPVPAEITAGKDRSFVMRYGYGTLVWGTFSGNLMAWRPEWGRSITLVPFDWPLGEKLGLSGAGYPRIFKQFVVWQPGSTYVLDLKTNSFAELIANAGGEDMTGSQLAMEWYTEAEPKKEAGKWPFDASIIDLSTLPDLDPCPPKGTGR
ncbi:hypothetical protein M6D93_04605 [Jatrophihabitans telluris]|uniref:Uncharacterized protein n=1 Tax=Jatrophihabitans telluris TaxID=2038343 RepID=A0ABY4R0G9_9ACTN|nr:hypothetical protein [Jatrophihabitans telluris]UQX89288.1 hypothetical protein M6D93_04605 [Jatrophihabitans telluris]